MKMKVLYLLASLCLLSVCLSSIQKFDITCQHDDTQCNDSCEWNISLSSCPTLHIHCLERHGRNQNPKICNSFEECNLTKPLKFFEYLIGNISCKHEDKSTKCQLSMSCNQTIYLCKDEECELDHILNTGDNKKICKFYHNVTRCIQIRGGVTCTKNTMTTGVTDSRTDCTPHPDKNDTDSFCIATICLGCLGVLFLGYIICIGKQKGWKTLNIFKNEDAEEANPGQQEHQCAEEANRGQQEHQCAEEANPEQFERCPLVNPGQQEHPQRAEEANPEQFELRPLINHGQQEHPQRAEEDNSEQHEH